MLVWRLVSGTAGLFYLFSQDTSREIAFLPQRARDG